MFKLRIFCALVLGSTALIALGGNASGGSAACQSGKYSGKTASGHKVSFTVDCNSKTITDLSLTFNARCQSDKHREAGQATYDGKIKIKSQTFPDPDHAGKKEHVYYLGSDLKATTLTAAGNAQSGTLLLRGTTPPSGTTRGTVNVDYSYGTDPGNPEEYLYFCGGADGNGPAKFTAKRR